MEQVTTILLKLDSDVSNDSSWQANNLVQIVNDEIVVSIKASEQDVLRKVQQAGRQAEKLGVKNAKISGDNWSFEQQWAFALGFTCVGKLSNVEFSGEPEMVNLLNDQLAVYAWSRDLTNQTPSQLVPVKLAELARDYLSAQAPAHISSEIIQGEELVQHGWTGIYNVGKGSENPPCLLVLDYNPTGDENAPVSSCLVGKGITFDSGGYSLKPSASMFEMKCDMGGAAVVAGALALAIRQGANKRIKLFLCCAENMVSSHAYKLGDILAYKNGVTVEVANTDAEGRLVLADGLMAATETGAPLIIDAATLTGAAMMATGAAYTAIFSMDDELADKAAQAAKQTQEPAWRLPLEKWHQDKCPSAFADTANSTTTKGGGAGGASNAAGFLARFVNEDGKGWLHCDLAAAYNGSGNGLWAAGGTGQFIATIAQLVR